MKSLLKSITRIRIHYFSSFRLNALSSEMDLHSLLNLRQQSMMIMSGLESKQIVEENESSEFKSDSEDDSSDIYSETSSDLLSEEVSSED